MMFCMEMNEEHVGGRFYRFSVPGKRRPDFHVDKNLVDRYATI